MQEKILTCVLRFMIHNDFFFMHKNFFSTLGKKFSEAKEEERNIKHGKRFPENGLRSLIAQ